MKTLPDLLRRPSRFLLWPLFAVLGASLPAAGAGLTIDVHLYGNSGGYYVFCFLSTNSMPGNIPMGTYTITTPPSASAASSTQFQSDGVNVNFLGGGADVCGDFPTLMQTVTNGNWTFVVTNATITNNYTFTVSAPVLPADQFGTTEITFPTQGATDVANQPTFTWQGPSPWEGTLNVNDSTSDANNNTYTVTSASLPATQTSWPSPVALPNGTNSFNVDYVSNATSIIVASTPVDSSLNPVSSWLSMSTLEAPVGSTFFVGLPASLTGSGVPGLTLIAHYTFDVNSGYNQADSSGNNNNINGGSSWVSSPVWGFSGNAIAGGGAFVLDGGENLADSAPPPDQTFDNLLATFYGSFSISIWMNTTTVVGNDTDNLNGNNGASIIWAYNNGVNDTIPIAITGHKAAFFTGDPTGGNGDTLHSTNDVTTGSYVHIVVTRDGSSGLKSIYINGALDSSDIGTTNHLDGDNGYYAIGGVLGSSYAGLLDDAQFYSGVLNAGEVAYLFNNPGSTVGNLAGSSGLVAYYDFDENTDLAADLSANGNNLLYGGNFGGPVISTNSISGSGAVYFNGGSFLTPSTNLLSIIAGNFSLSVWVKTTQNIAYNTAPGYYGAGIVSADIPGATNDLIPVALTGSAIGFNTGDQGSSDDTVNSVTGTINDGNYHHLVVTRDQATGVKQIYIDGVFSSSDVAATGLLNAPQLITIGALADASNPDPTSPQYTAYNGFVGLLDDLQIYSRVITSTEVAALYATPGSTVATGLAVHYDFDEGTVLAADVSGNGNDMVFAGSFNGPGPALTGSAESGPGALSFDGSSYLVPENNLVTNLAGSFSLSVWLQTSQTFDTAGDAAANGAGIITAEVQGQNFDLVPLALTGGNIAFGTDGFGSDTLTSTASINDGNYHHVVVTRDAGTGAKQIYIDGNLDNSDVADTALLNNPQILIFGAFSDASQSYQYSPSSGGYQGYVGLMDQVQIYSRVLSSTDVAFLYANPGSPLPVVSGAALGVAVDAPNLTWITSGDMSWFAETTNTYSGNAAAVQSGSLQDGQSSILQTTVTGPGTISFYWETMANNDNFTLVFDIDGNQYDNINGQSSWTQDTFTITSPGAHTLAWNANTLSGSGSSPTDAGFVDQVVFTSGLAPVITLNPVNQTNYPGYTVGLLAGATGAPAPTWQWYEVGNPSPLPDATNALFIPANFGTSAVAGSYYAVAGNLAGSQNTTTAMVTFLNVPLPDGWSSASRSPFQAEFSTNVILDYFAGCAVDAAGEVYVADQYIGDVNVLTNSTVANSLTAVGTDGGAALVKYDATGHALWAVGLTNNDTASYSYSECVAVAPGNGAYLASTCIGTNWLGANRYTNTGNGSILLSRFDADGSNLWSTFIGLTNLVFMNYNCLVSDASGNVTVAGYLAGTVDFGNFSLTAPAQVSGFLVQFNSNGVAQWGLVTAGFTESLAYGGGQLYVSLTAGTSGGTTNLGIGGLSLVTDRAYGLAALNATNGQALWLAGVGEQYGVTTRAFNDDIPMISTSGSDLFLTGTAYGSTALFGGLSVPLTGGRSQYFARYDTNGNAQAASGFGGPTTMPWASAASAAGVYVSGDFDDSSSFGNFLIAAPEYYPSYLGPDFFTQPFVAKFDRNGNPLWARNGVSPVLGNFRGVATTPGGVWASGFVQITKDSNAYAIPAQFGTNQISGDAYLQLGSPFSTVVFTRGGMLDKITESALPSAVTLLNPAVVGANFQFQFQSQAGFTHTILYQTSLGAANWLTYSSVPGDGTLTTISMPLSTFGPSQQGFVLISTQ